MSVSPSQTIYSSHLLNVGLFRCTPTHPHFHESSPACGHLLVFPRSAVKITQPGCEPVIANPNVVMLYNAEQPYRRDKISERGDICEWFSFSSDVLIEALRPYDPTVEEHAEQPFRATHTLCSNEHYLRQRLVVEHILHHTETDRLLIEETMLGVLEGVIRQAYQHEQRFERQSEAGRSRTEQQHREIARSTQELLSAQFDRELSLDQIAAQVYVSPFALCRIFRQQTGQTIHTYLNQLRLRTSLETVNHSLGRLTELALNLGYSSHSHFTQAFRSAFGLTPSEFYRIFRSPAQGETAYAALDYPAQTTQTIDRLGEHRLLHYQLSSPFRSIMK